MEEITDTCPWCWREVRVQPVCRRLYLCSRCGQGFTYNPAGRIAPLVWDFPALGRRADMGRMLPCLAAIKVLAGEPDPRRAGVDQQEIALDLERF